MVVGYRSEGTGQIIDLDVVALTDEGGVFVVHEGKKMKTEKAQIPVGDL